MEGPGGMVGKNVTRSETWRIVNLTFVAYMVERHQIYMGVSRCLGYFFPFLFFGPEKNKLKLGAEEKK